jgi:hypothetical protein
MKKRQTEAERRDINARAFERLGRDVAAIAKDTGMSLHEIADELADAWDDECTRHVDPTRLLDPIAFARINYDQERKKALKLSHTQRIWLGVASAVDWRRAQAVTPQKVRCYDDIARTFKDNNVKSFDELMTKWHGWKPAPSPDNDE